MIKEVFKINAFNLSEIAAECFDFLFCNCEIKGPSHYVYAIKMLFFL